MDLPIQTQGRPAKAVSVEIVRELTAADLVGLQADRGVRPNPIKRLTDMHHCIARLVAQGEAGYAIAMATGYSESRISILKSDPTFQELVETYRADVDDIRRDAFVNTQNKLVALHNDSIERLHDSVLDDLTLHPKDVLEIAKYAAGRTGFGPASKSANLNVNLDIAAQMAEGRQRGDKLKELIPVAKAAKDQVIDEPTRTSCLVEQDPEGS